MSPSSKAIRATRAGITACLAAGLLLVAAAGTPAGSLRAGSATPASLPPGLTAACAGDNPYLATTCFHSADLFGTNHLPSMTSVAGFNDTAEDLPNYILASQGEVGTTFGLAYSTPEHALYAAAFHKRQTRFGPGGPGAIYRIDLGALDVRQAITVPNAGPDRHSLSPRGPDTQAGPWAGKTSLGDIEISTDGSTLFAMNLNDRRIYRFELPSGRPIDSFETGGRDREWSEDARPFALAFRNDRLYHGVVHSAESSGRRNDLHAYVFASAPDGSAMRQVTDVDLGYLRGSIEAPWLQIQQPLAWRPWSDRDRGVVSNVLVRLQGLSGLTINPMPMLTDIEFDLDGSMVLALRDRNLDRAELTLARRPDSIGGLGAGDLLRGLPDGDTWQVSVQEHFDDQSRQSAEMAQGGLASIRWPRSIVAGLAPLELLDISRSVQDVARWFDPESGSQLRQEQICSRWGVTARLSIAPQAPLDDEFPGFVGSGDMELLCSSLPSPTPTESPTVTASPTVEPSATARPSSTARPSETLAPSPSPRPSATTSPTATPEPKPIYLPILLLQPDCARIPVSIALVLDASTSMRETTRAGRPKAEAAVEAARRFLDALRLPEDRAAIVAFNAEASLLAPLTGDRAVLDEALARFELAQFTRIDLGIEAARRELVDAAGEGETQAVIVLTDGRNNPEPVSSAVAAAARAKADGIRVFTIGLGSEIEEAALQEMASRPSDYRAAADGEDLAGIYQALAGAVRDCPGQWRP